ncbi:thiaminase II [Dehalococcoidia bacterium]|nr:thiaminase II [Dehalococcoidia bacterium]
MSDKLKRRSAKVWTKILDHPFILELGNGSLPLDKFRFFLLQDYLYLIEYGRVLALASAKAPELNGMIKFSELLHDTLVTEMDLHRDYCENFGITRTQLEQTSMSPSTSAYSRFLLSVAYEGSIEDITASILPCQWGYAEIGRKLSLCGDTSSTNNYSSWIAMYSSEEFYELGRWLCGYLDDLTSRSSSPKTKRLESLFLTSSRYEYLFWEMGYNKERWPV